MTLSVATWSGTERGPSELAGEKRKVLAGAM